MKEFVLKTSSRVSYVCVLVLVIMQKFVLVKSLMSINTHSILYLIIIVQLYFYFFIYQMLET